MISNRYNSEDWWNSLEPGTWFTFNIIPYEIFWSVWNNHIEKSHCEIEDKYFRKVVEDKK